MKPEAIRAQLAHLLAGAVGGSEAVWSERIGPVEVLNIVTNIQGNWRVHPTGTPDQVHAIEQAAALLAWQEPYAHGTPAVVQ